MFPYEIDADFRGKMSAALRGGVEHVPYYLALGNVENSETSTYSKTTRGICTSDSFQWTESIESHVEISEFLTASSANQQGTCSTLPRSAANILPRKSASISYGNTYNL